nr:MAG TPA: hypothetical protein [Caudoviricetes sp.]
MAVCGSSRSQRMPAGVRMHGKTDHQESLHPVRRQSGCGWLHEVHRHAGTVENLPDNRPPESRNSSSQRWY